ncbi:LOW QUALITY PROTEIN: leukotriene A-4 hydrolase [Lepeophtheirus salmonis]|uniref:LOW QUALITY PROTEIN: leukotriene A-4 hydrolase n=1 Tax=Lepeophtheirus salmonis TaxID=72036 RepID=UPI001AE44F80|nr:LOW QUALITY PROTEIN: leukotriene A-4 hydrolase-like [Lepeophtheirus salmonis]
MKMETKEEGKRLSPGDPSSYSRPDEVKVLETFLELDVNFEDHVLEGSATLTVEKVLAFASTLILDSRNLDISQVSCEGSELVFSLGNPCEMGSMLQIQLPKSKRGQLAKLEIKVSYKTEKDCSALQWLSPQQTAGKTHPYMFSQCQAIHCRSIVPCQDTPSVKSKYSAQITAPADLTVLMSAVRQEERLIMDGTLKVTSFLQKIPIQSYLIAIVVGKLESRDIGPRSKVWCEKEYIECAASDFSETETMITTAESICGPYIWGVYDILVLPPSFPFGGMENPCLTFVTPTILTGDKSLTDVIAHEIAHSWSGNLVTNSNFEHFWLNEGFTMFIERKIKAKMANSESLRHFEGIGGWKKLEYGIEVLGEDNPKTRLVPNLSGVDPDDAFSVVPYEKGFAFLWYLEELVGGSSVFDPFLKDYIETYKHQSIDSNTFKKFVIKHFPELESKVEWNDWFYKAGMPIYKPNYDTTLSKACEELKNKIIQGNVTNDFDNLNVGQKIGFLSLLMDESTALPVETLETMQKNYKLNDTRNSEIKFIWIRLGLKCRWEKAIEMAIGMIKEQGRMKFTRPLYRDLFAWDKTRNLALDTFRENKQNMMKVSIQGVEFDLKLR